jgi:hypothetical protein
VDRERYRDVIEAADTITHMRSASLEARAALKALKERSKPGTLKQRVQQHFAAKRAQHTGLRLLCDDSIHCTGD